MAVDKVEYKLVHFKYHDFELKYGGRITYKKEYSVTNIISNRPLTGTKKEIVSCPVCKKQIEISIASESRSKIMNIIFKSLSLIIFSLMIFSLFNGFLDDSFLLVIFGSLVSILIFALDYSKPKIIKDLKLNFIRHKILI